MSGSKNIVSLKSRLTIYKLGLNKAIQAGKAAEVSKWEDSITNLEQKIAELDRQS
ncbi:hypothetical protein V6615_11515 [Oscillospiraceae bacterium PP1C4]